MLMDSIKKKALIFGCPGQDAGYLAELLLSKDYLVIGVRRRASVEDNSNLDGVINNDNFSLLYGDLTDYCSIFNLINTYKPDEIYNLAAQSFVAVSFDQPLYTWQVNAQGVVNILEVLRSLQSDTYKPKFYQASTSEMFGHKFDLRMIQNPNDPFYTVERRSIYSSQQSYADYEGINFINEKYQNENTEMDPQSPYGVSKLAAHKSVGLYRRAYKMFACSGILFNHESPRRGKQFVTRKITDYIGKLKKQMKDNYLRFPDNGNFTEDVMFYGNDKMWVSPEKRRENEKLTASKYTKLKLGNIDSFRDWGHSRDYVEAMWLMLQQETPDDFVICTGETHTVREFLEEAFNQVGLNWEDYVEIDPSLFRAAEVDYLRGDAAKAKRELGWTPKTSFKDLVKEMVEADVEIQSR